MDFFPTEGREKHPDRQHASAFSIRENLPEDSMMYLIADDRRQLRAKRIERGA